MQIEKKGWLYPPKLKYKNKLTDLFPTPGCSHLSLLWWRPHFPQRSRITQTWASPASARNTRTHTYCFIFCWVISHYRLPWLNLCLYNKLYHSIKLIQHEGTSLMSYLKQSLLLDQRAFLQVPEVEMGLAAGHDGAAVSRVKVCAQHRLVGALGTKDTGFELTVDVREQSVLICQFNSPWPQPVCPLSASPTQKGRDRSSHPLRTVCFPRSEKQKIYVVTK